MVLRVAAGDSNLLRRELRGIQERTCRCALVISNDLAGRWLLISLRPEAAEAEPTQLLEECDSLLRSAGLDP